MLMTTALDNLLAQYQSAYAQAGQPLVVEANPDWQAPIYQQPLQQDWVHWVPVKQTQPLLFTDLANALEQPLHDSVEAFYSHWYAADLAVTFAEHPLQLLQNHGPEDAERLQANLAGHVLMKRRLKQPITLFVGLAEESDDLLITVDNDSGVVGLEFVGQPQHQQLAPSLQEFIQQLSPRVVDQLI